MKSTITFFVIAVIAVIASVVPSCKSKDGHGGANRARARLRGVKSISIKYLPSMGGKNKKTTLTLTRPEQISGLIGTMRFKKAQRCACKHKYRIDFKRSTGRTVTVFAYSHGWNFADEKGRQRAPGTLLEHIDRLFGIPEGKYYLE